MDEPSSDSRRIRHGANLESHLVPRLRKVLFSVVTMLVVLLLLEAGARIVTPGAQSQRFRQINQIVIFLGTQPSDLMLDFDPARFWKLKPNIAIDDPNNTFWQGTVSNSLGFRCPEFSLAKASDTLRVVCFGDSSTFGIGARMEDTWPAQLQQLLTDKIARGNPAATDTARVRRIEVINAGVPGYTSHQGLQHMRQKLDDLDPDIVMASYANNDFWHWDDQTDAQQAARLNQHGDLHDFLMHSRCLQLLDAAISQVRSAADTETIASASPNQHWAQAATFNYFAPNDEWIRRVPLESFRDNVNQMADMCEQRNLPLILVKWPDQPQAAGNWSPRIVYQDVLEEIAAQRRLQIADVVELFQDNCGWSLGTYVPNDIVHVNRDGNSLAAIAARDAIERLGGRSNFLTN
ncbi:MAG: GDSL-type esterase/lipase family protein [Fuerstiella sp.]|jgi:lysophospholipase L1-like esterase|nr:GDSL-type esterase/lipase family protein [Fuerstiella sp.]